MRRRTQFVAVLLAALTAGSIAGAQAAKQQGSGSKAAMTREMSDRLWADVGTALKKGDAAAVAAMYTDDAVLMDAEQPTIIGKAATTEFIKRFLAAGKVTEHSHVTEAIETAGDMALEHGRWTIGFLENGKAKPTVSEARYLLVWKRAPDGKWLVHRDMSIPNPAKPGAKKPT